MITNITTLVNNFDNGGDCVYWAEGTEVYGTMYFLLNFAMNLGSILELSFLKGYLKGRNFFIFKNNIKEKAKIIKIRSFLFVFKKFFRPMLHFSLSILIFNSL